MTAIPAEWCGARTRADSPPDDRGDRGNPRELADGLSIRFPAREYEAVAEFVARERLCCPFVTFTLDVTPDQGPLMLRITGADGVKEFIPGEVACGIHVRLGRDRK